MIPYSRQSVDEEDVEAVIQVLRSDWLTQGPATGNFEASVSNYCEVAFAVCFNSATSALHAACLALDVGDKDLVWTSPISFVASANCAKYCGASIDFVDIDPDTINICERSLEEKLREAGSAGRLPKILIVVHFGGLSCNMQKIYELCRNYGVKIIEDASHAMGASYLGSKVGSCKYSDLAVFSLHPVKMITSGEGGLVTTNSDILAEKLRLFGSHGIERQPNKFKRIPSDPWAYEQQYLGYNYRMSDIHASLGMSQLGKINKFTLIRNKLATSYRANLASQPLQFQHIPGGSKSSYHLFVVMLDRTLMDIRTTLFEKLRAASIGVQIHYIPIFMHNYHYDRSCFASCPNAIEYYKRTLTLPCYPGLSDMEQEVVVDTFKGLLK